MANIGDKYIIEISGVFKNEDQRFRKPLYKMMHFNSLVFDEEGISRLTPYEPNNDEEYQRGFNDAWEATQAIFRFVEDGGMSSEELRNAFGTGITAEIATLPIRKVMSTLTEYEAKKKAEEEIKVGDEVIRLFTHSEGVVIELPLKGDIVTVLGKTGHAFGTLKSNLKKTGRHFPQVAELLDAMKEDGDTNA